MESLRLATTSMGGPRSSSMPSTLVQTVSGSSLPGQGAQFKGCSGGASALEKLAWGPPGSGHVWYRAAPGLNIEGICMTPSCKAYGKKVIYKAGFTSLDLVNSGGRCQCPCCQHSFIPATAAFTRCEWKFSGTKKDTPRAAPEKVEMEEWELAGNQYERFKEDTDDTTVWTQLIITTRPAPIPAQLPGITQHQLSRQFTGSSDPNLVDCSICCGEPLSRFGPTAINTPCGHCFHRECLKPWVLAGKRACPTCRRDISCLAIELQK